MQGRIDSFAIQKAKSDYVVKEIGYLKEIMKSWDRETADKERMINLMMEMNKK